MQAGQDESRFWRQTPATFDAVMKGVARRLDNEARGRTAQAWETAALGAAAKVGKLKPLADYLPKTAAKPDPKRVRRVMEDAIARGAPIRIRKIKGEGTHGDDARIPADQPGAE